MTKEQFNEKLPLVLEALKEAITNEIGNNYDFNFNDYADLAEKEFDYQTFEIFKRYALAISLIEEDAVGPTDKQYEMSVIANAIGDYNSGGYRWTEEDDEDDFQFDETPFETNDEMNEFIEILENYEE